MRPTLRRAPRRRLHGPLLWLVAIVAAYLLVQLALTLVEELPKIVEGLK
jgi:hypothetical protein